MLTLYSYPELFGVADNNGYGLKVFAFLRLCAVDFRHEHILDASAAPRGQLPYITDDGDTIGDSDAIIAYVTQKYRLAIDAALTPAERDTDLMIGRLLDDLYWVMSYSRWKDDRYWPAFRDALLRQHPSLTEADLLRAREFNAKRYHFQGIGRYEPDAAMARGVADLQVLANLIPAHGYIAWGEADRYRCRDLRLHCQYLLLRYRHAAQTVRRGARQSGPPLPGDPPSRHGPGELIGCEAGNGARG